MALSGTSLTVTTLTTAGLLTNNVSGQVSSVTGSSLGTLLGGTPTFTGLTLSGLNTGILKVTSGLVGLATSGDYQAPISNGTNISLTGSGTIINVVPSPSFAGLTLSGGTLANTMLKTVAGVISPATVNNDYQAALTPGTNILFTTNNTVINTVTNPTFAGINCSSTGTNNTLLGTFAGSNLLSSGLGSNTLCGYRAGVNITSGTYNTCIGVNAGSSITSGANSVYIGNAADASSGTVTNEGVINLSGSATTGKGANTMLINASSGLYSYLPAFWWGYAQYTVGTTIRWNTKTNRGIVLNPVDDTQILCPIPGLYEFTLSGSIFCNATSVINMNMNVNGSVYLAGPAYYSGLIGWRAISVSAFVVVTNTTTYVQYVMGSGMETSVSAPTILTAKFISL
jgi:hypothetical protein